MPTRGSLSSFSLSSLSPLSLLFLFSLLSLLSLFFLSSLSPPLFSLSPLSLPSLSLTLSSLFSFSLFSLSVSLPPLFSLALSLSSLSLSLSNLPCLPESLSFPLSLSLRSHPLAVRVRTRIISHARENISRRTPIPKGIPIESVYSTYPSSGDGQPPPLPHCLLSPRSPLPHLSSSLKRFSYASSLSSSSVCACPSLSPLLPSRNLSSTLLSLSSIHRSRSLSSSPARSIQVPLSLSLLSSPTSTPLSELHDGESASSTSLSPPPLSHVIHGRLI